VSFLGRAYVWMAESMGGVMADRGDVRALRAAVFTVVCVLLATAGHGMSAGVMPAPAAVLAGGSLTLLLAARLAGRERSLVEILAGVFTAQLGVHLLYLSAAAPDQGPRTAHEHAAAYVAVHAHHASGPFMLLAHAVAGLVAAWWLRRGEVALWEMCRRLAAVAALPFLALLGIARSLPATEGITLAAFSAGDSPTRLTSLVLRHAVIRRGPPAALLAC
jgi:hypothetical protein